MYPFYEKKFSTSKICRKTSTEDPTSGILRFLRLFIYSPFFLLYTPRKAVKKHAGVYAAEDFSGFCCFSKKESVANVYIAFRRKATFVFLWVFTLSSFWDNLRRYRTEFSLFTHVFHAYEIVYTEEHAQIAQCRSSKIGKIADSLPYVHFVIAFTDKTRYI